MQIRRRRRRCCDAPLENHLGGANVSWLMRIGVVVIGLVLGVGDG